MARVRFEIASGSHDEGIRKLLRETSFGKNIAVSLRREPSYFRSLAIDGTESTTIIAIDSGRIACVGSVVIRERYFNGRAMRVGYLGNLRLATSHAGRFDILRMGYRFFDSLRPTLNVAAYFTSIASDNERAIRLLERGVRGLPAYKLAGELITLLIYQPSRFWTSDAPSGRARGNLRRLGMGVLYGEHAEPTQIATLLSRSNASFQFATVCPPCEINRTCEHFGLSLKRFRIANRGEDYIACAALWDQRDHKQAIVARYPRRLRWARPVYNLFAKAPLPRAGRPIPQAFVSHVATPEESPEVLEQLIRLLMAPAKTFGIQSLVIGFDARDPRLALLQRQFPTRQYRTRLYSVVWQDEAADAELPDGRLLYPEVALL